MSQVTGCQDMYDGKRLLRHDGHRKGRRGVAGVLEPGACLKKEEIGRAAAREDVVVSVPDCTESSARGDSAEGGSSQENW